MPKLNFTAYKNCSALILGQFRVYEENLTEESEIKFLDSSSFYNLSPGSLVLFKGFVVNDETNYSYAVCVSEAPEGNIEFVIPFSCITLLPE